MCAFLTRAILGGLAVHSGTPDAGRILAALLSGAIATQAHVASAAATGVRWAASRALTINAYTDEG